MSSTGSAREGPRIIVIGDAGAGKTVLASQLAEMYHVRHVELDALFWEPDWTPALPEVFRARIVEALAGDEWVVDGSYTNYRDVIWQRAATIVWLDYPLPLLLWRLWWRTLRRVRRREPLWGTNQERMWTQFFSRESLFFYVIATYRRRRATLPGYFQEPAFADLEVVRLRSPSETKTWLARLPRI